LEDDMDGQRSGAALGRVVGIVTLALVSALGFGCNKADASGGVGAAASASAKSPVEAIEVPAFEISTAQADVDKGKELFASKGCAACHKIGGGKLVGPDLQGVTARRDKTWIARMILHPEIMTKEDETAKGLFKVYMTQMTNQGIDPKDQLPALIAYLKSNEK
jgi:mono/diheme cytochrome c family protein